jgi:hypothetical protein
VNTLKVADNIQSLRRQCRSKLGTSSVRRLLWSGHLVLMELDGNNNVLRKYTWGLDVAGLMGGTGVSPVNAGSAGVSPASLCPAAGVGGLLAMEDLDPQ